MILSAEEFVRLRESEDPSEYIRSGVDTAELSVWLDIIYKHPEMKVWVARNRTVPPEVIRLLAKDNDPLVSGSISRKYPLEDDLYHDLSRDIDEGIRAGLTYNKKIPIDILKYMSENDSSEFVKEVALEKYNQRIYSDN